MTRPRAPLWLTLVLACSSPPPPANAPPPASITLANSSFAPSPSPSPSAIPSAIPPAPQKLNVILLSIDALRADMPWAGYPRDIAPYLTAFEKKCVSYERAYSISSYTAMSVGGLLAGRYPSELQRSGFFFSAYPDEELMFPELLQQAGVRTLAAHAHWYFDTKSGFRQGFDVYRMVDGIVEDNKKAVEITSPKHLALAQEILGSKSDTAGQFFAWFHFVDPHDLYLEHDGIDFGKRARDRYDGEVLFTDRHIGKLIDFIEAQPWGERTAIIVTADHGEAFGEHKMSRHGFELWDVLVHVPLMVKIPGAPPRHITTPRSAIDLAPTVLELLGLPPSPGFQGKSLASEIRGEAEPEPRAVIIDLPRTSDNRRRRALVWDRYKIIALDDDFRFELYDLVADPGETIDLRHRDPVHYELMKARYLEASKTIHDVCPKMRDKLLGRRKERPC